MSADVNSASILHTPALYRTGVKLLTVLLLSLSLLIGLLSSAVAVVMGERGFYFQSYEECREEIYRDVARSSAYRLSYVLYSDFLSENWDDTQSAPDVDKLREWESAFPALSLHDVAEESLLITILDQDGNIIFTNRSEETPLYEEEVVALQQTLPDGTLLSRTIRCAVPTVIPQGRGSLLSILESLLPHLWAMRGWIIVIALGAWICTCVLFFLLMAAAGHQPGEKEPRLTGPARLPVDILTVLAVIGGYFLLLLLSDVYARPSFFHLALLAIVLIPAIPLAIGYLMCLAANGKCHTLWKRSFLSRVLTFFLRILRGIGRRILLPLGKGVVQIFSALPLISKTVLGLLAATLAEGIILLVTQHNFSLLMTLWIIRQCLLIPLLLWLTLGLRRLQTGGQKLAAGDLQYEIQTDGLIGDFRRHAEDLNSISSGMSRAVEERTRSDRMRTELITNVSHDLKTPLTSIINYIDLLQKAPGDSPEAATYLKILERQSTRLKKLIEDLMEVSKASTGNLNMELTPIATDVLLSQAVGEYAERMKAAGLETVLREPDTSPVVLADGRLLWRIFDNLLSNAVKYALPGTRVYLDVCRDGDCAQLIFRNISREPLHVTAEELLERFVRGDSSRHTDGNGLGLSIARSLCESMHGTLALAVDGDLFKVTLTFPLYHPPVKRAEAAPETPADSTPSH